MSQTQDPVPWAYDMGNHVMVQERQSGTGTRPPGAVPADCRCTTCTAYRERTAPTRNAQRGAANDLHARRRPPGRSRPADGFEAWRRRRLPARVAGLVVGLLIAVV